MKGSQLYFIILGAFVVLVFLFELAAPKKFVWTPTFDKNSREPFGSYVFDDVLSSSIPDYKIMDSTFFQILEADSTISNTAFLLTEDYLSFSETDIAYMQKLLENGNQIMLCSENLYFEVNDTVRVDSERDYYYYKPLNSFIKENDKTRDSIFMGKDTTDFQDFYAVYPFTHQSYIEFLLWVDSISTDTTYYENDSIAIDTFSLGDWKKLAYYQADTLVRNKENKPQALRIPHGKGELFVVSTSLMFTNFGVLDGDNAEYVFRLLSYMKGKPLIRLEAYGDHDTSPSTPLRYLLVTPPLRWAIYTVIVLLLLFMIFTAKRRQRVIPVVETPPNRALGFILLISNLSYQRHDNAEILKTKYSVFCSDVKRQTGIDLQDSRDDNNELTRLAEKIGLPEDETAALVKELRLIPYQYDMPDRQMKELMDKINRIRDVIG
ncbi:MAG: hypothetical protein LBE91_12550 [Tannerella sp.]|jgi:hypothetical protein|nr:hypothetical protein [Tannerella sp.]